MIGKFIKTLVTSLVPSCGGRVYPLIIPQDNNQWPAIGFTTISTERPHALDTRSSGYASARIQLAIWDPTHAAAKVMAESCRMALDGYSGEVTNADGSKSEINHVLWDNEVDLYDAEMRLFGVSVDFLVAYNEDRPA